MPSPAVASQSRSSSWTADISASARVALRSASNAACRSAWSDSSSRRAAMEMPRWRACAASLSRVGIGTRIVVVCVATNYILDHLLLWRFWKLRRFSGLSPESGRRRVGRLGSVEGADRDVDDPRRARGWHHGWWRWRGWWRRHGRATGAAAGGARLGAAPPGAGVAGPALAGPAPAPALWSRCRRWVTWLATAAPATTSGAATAVAASPAIIAPSAAAVPAAGVPDAAAAPGAGVGGWAPGV